MGFFVKLQHADHLTRQLFIFIQHYLILSRLSVLAYMLSTILLCLASLLSSSTSYDLVRDYSGTTFFDRWDFYGNWDDLTLGLLA